MCIICLKPAGIDMPSDDEIKHMFNRNPDGAGFALQGDIHNDGRFLVEYQKGFMNCDDLLEALGPKDKLKNLTVAIHCRIKTSGEKDKFTTHPFLISDQYSDLRKTEGSGAVLFHNGVFSGLGGIINEKSSDTQDFVVGVANRYLKNAKMPGKISQAIVSKIAGDCRILILYPKRNFPALRFGNWYEHKGCYYSNMGYKDETSYSSYSGYSGSYNRLSTGKYHDYDEWGCNVAEYAWPSSTDTWIRFTDDRWENLIRAVKSEELKAGEKIVKFQITGDKEWILDEVGKQIYTADRREDVSLREDEEDYQSMMLESGAIYEEREGYIWFQDDEVMLDWTELAKKKSEYVYKYRNQIWYLDTINCEAYTEQGLKTYFEPGEVGHVRKSLIRNGYYQSHKNSASIRNNEEDDDDCKIMKMIDEDLKYIKGNA